MHCNFCGTALKRKSPNNASAGAPQAYTTPHRTTAPPDYAAHQRTTSPVHSTPYRGATALPVHSSHQESAAPPIHPSHQGAATTPPYSAPYGTTATPPYSAPYGATAPPPYSAPQGATPRTPVYKKTQSQGSKHLTAAIAMVVALIIFTMQLNWVVISIDVGGLSGSLMTDMASRDDLLDAMQAAGVADQFHDIDAANLADAITIFTNIVTQEIMDFIDSIHILDHNISITDLSDLANLANLPNIADLVQIGDPPDVAAIINIFINLVLLEITQFTSSMGELSQSLSISDIPNVIATIDLIIDSVLQEASGWGMSPADINRIAADTQAIRTAEEAVNILRIVFAACAFLLMIFVYLLVAGARPARIVGVFSIVLVFLLSGAFAIAMTFGNNIIADTFGDYIRIGAGLYVYVTALLCVLAFVLTIVHRKKVTQ